MVLGHSMGARVAIRAAVLDRSRIARLHAHVDRGTTPLACRVAAHMR
jgi:hypothetical protein